MTTSNGNGKKRYPATRVSVNASEQERLTHFLSRTLPGGIDGTCWIWQGAQSRKRWTKYPEAKVNGRVYGVHRLVYAWTRGEPIQWTIHHVCEETLCVNPAHLQHAPMLAHTGRRHG